MKLVTNKCKSGGLHEKHELYNEISSFHVNFNDNGPSYEILSELSLFSQQIHGYVRQFRYNLHIETFTHKICLCLYQCCPTPFFMEDCLN